MKNQKFLKTLTDIGFSQNEAAVYLACLSLGPTTIQQISRASEIKRTTVYSVIESLKKAGVINIEVRGFKQLYTAEPPERLEAKLEEQKNQFKKILPELNALYNLKGEAGAIKYYEGLAAVKTVYEGLLKAVRPHDDYLVISDQETWFKQDAEFFLNFIERRAKLPIKIRLLLTDTESARDFQKNQKRYNEVIKILPKSADITVNIVIIPERVVFHQMIPPIMALVVENKNIIQAQRELFEIIWNSLPD